MLREISQDGGFAGSISPSSDIPFIPSSDQMGLLIGYERIVGLKLPMEIPEAEVVEAKDMNGRIKQGRFERVKLADLNTVTQQRQEYNEIDTLSGNIREIGLIHPLLVSRYTTKEGAQAYLDAVYRSIGRRVPSEERKRLQDIKASVHDGQEMYDILVSGHRRFRALHMLEAEDIVLQVIENIDPKVALKMQVSENTPKLPKDYERANSYGELYDVDIAFSPGLTMKEFARSVGASEAVVRRDLRFYNLPDEVKAYVIPRGLKDSGFGNSEVPDQPLMNFNVACQLGRMVEVGAPKSDILLIARNFFVDKIINEGEASKRVTNYIRDTIRNGSTNMLDIFGVNMARIAKARRAREAGQKYAPLFDGATAYLRRVEMARELGFEDGGEESVSFAGAATRLRTFAKVAEALLPHLRSQFENSDEVERIRGVFQEMRELAEEVIDVVGIEETEDFFSQTKKSPATGEVLLFQLPPSSAETRA